MALNLLTLLTLELTHTIWMSLDRAIPLGNNLLCRPSSSNLKYKIRDNNTKMQGRMHSFSGYIRFHTRLRLLPRNISCILGHRKNTPMKELLKICQQHQQQLVNHLRSSSCGYIQQWVCHLCWWEIIWFQRWESSRKETLWILPFALSISHGYPCSISCKAQNSYHLLWLARFWLLVFLF